MRKMRRMTRRRRRRGLAGSGRGRAGPRGGCAAPRCPCLTTRGRSGASWTTCSRSSRRTGAWPCNMGLGGRREAGRCVAVRVCLPMSVVQGQPASRHKRWGRVVDGHVGSTPVHMSPWSAVPGGAQAEGTVNCPVLLLAGSSRRSSGGRAAGPSGTRRCGRRRSGACGGCPHRPLRGRAGPARGLGRGLAQQGLRPWGLQGLLLLLRVVVMVTTLTL